MLSLVIFSRISIDLLLLLSYSEKKVIPIGIEQSMKKQINEKELGNRMYLRNYV